MSTAAASTSTSAPRHCPAVFCSVHADYCAAYTACPEWLGMLGTKAENTFLIWTEVLASARTAWVASGSKARADPPHGLPCGGGCCRDSCALLASIVWFYSFLNDASCVQRLPMFARSFAVRGCQAVFCSVHADYWIRHIRWQIPFPKSVQN